jgi:hypothetical protein
MTKFKDLTNDEIGDIHHWNQNGISQRELAEIYGVSRAVIRRALLVRPEDIEPSPTVGEDEAQSGPVESPRVALVVCVAAVLIVWLGVILYFALR